MKKITLLFFLQLCIRFTNAQFGLLPDAITNPLTLPFTAIVINPGSVVYHPTEEIYYISRCGASTFPLLTLSSTGVLLNTTTTGLDTRGMWWNSNTLQLERNCFNTIGWSTINLDANSFATNTFSTIFTGLHQPDVQSVGAYDPVNNHVLFYFGGNLKKYSRTTGLEVSSIALTGVALTNINSNTVIYTGVAGFEIGILDYIAKKVLLFNINTGVFAGSSQLPATAVTASSFKFSYANGLVWLFHGDNSWHSYIIWGLLLPVHDLQLSGNQDANVNVLDWTVLTDVEIQYFDIEKVGPDESISIIGKVEADASSGSYRFVDKAPEEGCNYYRVTSTDVNNNTFSSNIICVEFSEKNIDYSLYPNPVIDELHINTSGKVLQYTLMNSSGQSLTSGFTDINGALPVAFLPNGVYLIDIEGKVSVFVKQ